MIQRQNKQTKTTAKWMKIVKDIVTTQQWKELRNKSVKFTSNYKGKLLQNILQMLYNFHQ